MERDRQLDIYRGLSMIYVVCVIHVTYWLKLGREPYLSLLLFEMPVIFFISGATQSVINRNRSLLQSCKSRIKRVLIPYYIYAAVIIGMMLVISLIWHLTADTFPLLNSVKRWTDYHVLGYDWKDFFKVLTAQDIPQAHYVWHLWFIVPYLILSCTFNIQRKIISLISPHVYLVICFIVAIIIQVITDNSCVRYVSCYNIFMVAGFVYYKKLTRIKIVVMGVVSFVLLVLCVKWGRPFVPLQEHKFPPDITFVFYGIVAISILSLILGQFRVPDNKCIRIWNARGYTIYQ